MNKAPAKYLEWKWKPFLGFIIYKLFGKSKMKKENCASQDSTLNFAVHDFDDAGRMKGREWHTSTKGS